MVDYQARRILQFQQSLVPYKQFYLLNPSPGQLWVVLIPHLAFDFNTNLDLSHLVL